MRKVYFLVLVVFALVVLVNARGGDGDDSINPQLKDVKKIYITELGTTDSSDIVREKIRLRLIKTGKFTVVESREEADAIFTGTVVMETHLGGGGLQDIDTKNKGVAVFHLRRPASGEIIWTYEYKPKFFNIAIWTDKATRGYNRVAERTVERLMKDAGYKK